MDRNLIKAAFQAGYSAALEKRGFGGRELKRFSNDELRAILDQLDLNEDNAKKNKHSSFYFPLMMALHGGAIGATSQAIRDKDPLKGAGIGLAAGAGLGLVSNVLQNYSDRRFYGRNQKRRDAVLAELMLRSGAPA